MIAFKDLVVDFYEGTIRIEYKDASHRYYRRELQPDGSWGKAISTKGVTTIMDNVLEKKGLMTWPLGMAMRELFGYYDFKNENGERMQGFSKGVGTMWAGDELIMGATKDSLLPFIHSANTAWQRKKKTGADIGSLVHDAIEHHVLGKPFDVTVEQYKIGQIFETPAEEHEWDKKAEAEVAQANLALAQFKVWWGEKKPKLIGAEALVYSKKMQYCGTFDGLIELDGKLVLCDWKTSNASTSKEAAAPQGIYYSYFIQSAAYAAAWEEMGNGKVDDLLIVSCRKDGGFDTISASQLGLTVDECINWWKAVGICYQMATKSKKGLLEGVVDGKDDSAVETASVAPASEAVAGSGN